VDTFAIVIFALLSHCLVILAKEDLLAVIFVLLVAQEIVVERLDVMIVAEIIRQEIVAEIVLHRAEIAAEAVLN
jgi:hypothetical protein